MRCHMITCSGMLLGRLLRSKWHYGIAAVMLAMHAGLLLFSICHQFPTRNEVAHLPAALAHWNSGTFSVYKVNPPTWRMIAVLPALSLQPQVDTSTAQTEPWRRKEWLIARAFAKQNAADYWSIMRLSRIAGLVWSVLGGVLVYSWSRSLFGTGAGLIGLTLWCFDPNILAHAALLTPDMPLTVAAFGVRFCLKDSCSVRLLRERFSVVWHLAPRS